MEKKKNYIAPAVLDELLLEMEGQILVASEMDTPIDDDVEVRTMGQEIGGTLSDSPWDYTWGE